MQARPTLFEAPASGDPLDHLVRVVEALLFVASEPVPPAGLAEVFRTLDEVVPTEEDVARAVARLNSRFEASGTPLRVQTWAGGYQLATVLEMAPYVEAFLEQPRALRLSRTILEALAVVAYRQPVTKPQIDHVRGVDSDYAVRRLLELGLIDVVGRSETLGRPLLYGTTDKFLEALGLAGLDDLPTLREIEEILQDPAFSHERARLLDLEGLAPASSSPDSGS